MTSPYDFKNLQVWQFSTEKLTEDPRPSYSSQLKRRTITVLSPSFDEAFKLFREKHPDLRVNQVLRHDIGVDYLVTTPEAWKVAERLTT